MEKKLLLAGGQFLVLGTACCVCLGLRLSQKSCKRNGESAIFTEEELSYAIVSRMCDLQSMYCREQQVECDSWFRLTGLLRTKQQAESSIGAMGGDKATC